MKYIKISPILILLFIAHTDLKGQSCPGATESSISEVKAFISSDSWATDRYNIGFSGVTTDQVVTLSDTSKCNALNSIFAEAITHEIEVKGASYRLNKMSYLKADNYYFVYISYKDIPGIVMLGTVGLYIYDSNLNELGAYAF